MSQNRSNAVMATRVEAKDALDFFPTPCWATRALLVHVIGEDWRRQSVWEPAAGRGDMVKPLLKYFGEVLPSDVHDYGPGFPVWDFLNWTAPDWLPESGPDWIITNPPFLLAEDFIVRALGLARVGVAMLVRTQFLEGVGRYNRLFVARPPTQIAFFSERVPMVKGRLDKDASTATSYSWLVWWKGISPRPPLWVPPCRKTLELVGDYETP